MHLGAYQPLTILCPFFLAPNPCNWTGVSPGEGRGSRAHLDCRQAEPRQAVRPSGAPGPGLPLPSPSPLARSGACAWTWTAPGARGRGAGRGRQVPLARALTPQGIAAPLLPLAGRGGARLDRAGRGRSPGLALMARLTLPLPARPSRLAAVRLASNWQGRGARRLDPHDPSPHAPGVSPGDGRRAARGDWASGP